MPENVLSAPSDLGSIPGTEMSGARPCRVAILGGGLSGLAAAYRLLELSRQSSQPLEISLFEAGGRLGGAVGTVQREGYLIDTGADSFLTNKPGAVALCRRLGIEDRLIPTDSRHRGALVLFQGQPVPVPEGFQLLSPTAIWPILTTPLLSPWGKLRLMSEWFIPRASVRQDESLADFVRRRLGREALEHLVQPLVGGIYTSDPEKLSLEATLPRFLDMEQQQGGLLRATLCSATRSPAEDRTSSGARYGLFAGLKGGMQDLVEALTAAISPHCKICLNSPVQQIQSTDQGWSVTVQGDQVDASNRFETLLITLPAFAAAKLLPPSQGELAGLLNSINYASSAIIVTGHALSQIRHPLNAFGLVIPEREHRKILATSFSSRKFPERAPQGRVQLRTFLGGALHPEVLENSDEELVEIVQQELRETLGVTGQPDFALVVRYPRAMPQYELGHLGRVSRIEALTQTLPHLELTGTAYRGVGVPDAIEQAEKAAERLLQKLVAQEPKN